MFYNYFENVTDKFKLTIKNKIQSHIPLNLKMVLIMFLIFQKL